MIEEKERKNKRQNNMDKKKKKKKKKQQLNDQNLEEKENESEEKKILVKEDWEEKKNSEEKSEQISNNKKKKGKRKEVFPFGNYRSYYGYRIGQGMDEDPRLKVLKREWFEGKDCLDIGCNCGVITIQIAKKFHCRKILGIDIDSDRIADAYWHLRKFVRTEQAGKSRTKESEPEVAENVYGSESSTTQSSVEKNVFVSDGSCFDKIDIFDIVSFRKENFVQSWRQPEEHYDTILCLSVTKWIHLNWGDDGLITLFSKIWRLLRPGGILVLEPQPWRSYENNHLVSEPLCNNGCIMTVVLCGQQCL